MIRIINRSTLVKAIWFLSFIWMPAVSFAEEMPLFYQGIRPLGMGGAFTAVADDDNALFYNPAGLLQKKGKGNFEIILPVFSTLEWGQNANDLANGVNDISESGGSDQTVDLVNLFLGEPFHLKTSYFPNLIIHNFGVGLLTQGSISGTIHSPLSSNVLEAKGQVDVAMLFSYARPVTVKKMPIYVGVTTKGVRRGIVEKSYSLRELTATTTKFDPDTDIKQGTGVALDLGFLYPMSGRVGSPLLKSMAMQPTVGLSLQNIVGGDLGNAGEIPFQANLGVALDQKVGWGAFLLAADIVDLTRNVGDDNNFSKRLHMGLEYQLPYVLTLRTGLYQGYPSFGTTIDLWLIHLTYAYYVEEIGAFAGQIPDARHVVKLSFF